MKKHFIVFNILIAVNTLSLLGTGETMIKPRENQEIHNLPLYGDNVAFKKLCKSKEIHHLPSVALEGLQEQNRKPILID